MKQSLYEWSVAHCAEHGHDLIEWPLIGRMLCRCCGRTWKGADL